MTYIVIEVMKLVKIYIDPGHGGSDPGATGYGLREKDINLDIGKKMRDMLNDYENVTVRMSRTGDKTVSLSQRTRDANNWGADYYISIHINAGGGTGFESFVYRNVSSRTSNYQRTIHNEIMKEIDLQNRGMKKANFHVLRETRMPAILTENGFIDNRNDANKLKSSSFRTALARGHVNGIVKAFNLKKKKKETETPPKQESPSKNELYKVQIGAFKERKNADDLVKKAKEKGFDAFVAEDDGLFRVQIGAFKERKNAEDLEKKAKAKGLDVFIRS